MMKAQNDVRVTIRVDKDLKERAEILFDRLGLNMSTALNVFLHKAVEESAIPFMVSMKKTEFGAGYSADDITNAFTKIVENEIADNQKKGFPTAKYDADKKQAYLESADGTREYING